MTTKAYTSSFLNSLFKIIKGPVLTLIIITFLTPIDQGYWYTFQSLALFTIIGDIGISRLVVITLPSIVQDLKSSSTIESLRKNRRKLSSLLYFYFILYLFSILVVIVILIFSVFYLYPEWPIIYKNIWIFVAIVSSINLLSTLVSSVLYSFNEVSIKNYSELVFGVLYSVIIILVLWLDGGLWSMSYGIAGGFLLTNTWLYFYYKNEIKKIFRLASFRLGYVAFKEYRGLQLKFFFTSILSLYISSSIIPFSMKFFSNELTGKLGLSLFIMNSLLTVTQIISYIKYPEVVQLVSSKEFVKVRLVVFEIFRNITITYIVVFSIVLLFIYFPSSITDDYVDRILPFNDFLVLVATQFVLMQIGYIAGVVRAFGVEPYWIMGIFQLFTTSFLLYVSYFTHSLSIFLHYDFILHVIFLFPLSVYLGRKQLKFLFYAK